MNDSPSFAALHADADQLFDWTTERIRDAFRGVLAGPVAPRLDIEGLRDWLSNLDLDSPHPAREVVAETIDRFAANSVHSTHPAYFGLFNPAPLIWGEIADMIAARFNPQLAVWSQSPAAVEMEQHALKFMLTRIGFASGAGFFCSGGEEANRCALLTALARLCPDYADHGVAVLPRQPVFYISSESHLAWLKIAASAGLGRRNVRLVPVSPDLRMDVEALEEMIAGDREAAMHPLLIAATAGTTAAGVVDPLLDLAKLAAREQMSFHVDAAWAGAAVLSDRAAPALHGIGEADSVTIDAHKWMSQPMGTGMFFTRHREALDAAFGVEASYMPQAVEGRVDYYRTSPSWSRRWLGLRLFLTLAVAGRKGIEAQIDRDIGLGEELRVLLAGSGWRIVNDTPFPVVCFTREGSEQDEQWHEAVARHVVGSGRAWISTVRLNGRPALRACIINWRTERRHLDELASALADALQAVGA